jgi:hypothetical protein
VPSRAAASQQIFVKFYWRKFYGCHLRIRRAIPVDGADVVSLARKWRMKLS